jgi:hypothetical protein
METRERESCPRIFRTVAATPVSRTTGALVKMKMEEKSEDDVREEKIEGDFLRLDAV